MELDRFANLIVSLTNEFRLAGTQERLQALESALQLSLARNDAPSAEAFVAERQALTKALSSSRANALRPTEAHMLESIGARSMFGNALLERIRQAIDGNSVTPAIALRDLADLRAQTGAFFSATDQFLQGLRGLGYTRVQDDANEFAEVGIVLPRELVQNSLEGLQKELRFLDMHLRTFGELVEDAYGSPTIRSLSTGSFELFFDQPDKVAEAIMAVVGGLVHLYKDSLEIREIKQRLRQKNVSQATIEAVEVDEEQKITSGITDIVESLMARYAKKRTKGREAELRTKLVNAVKYLADRIDRGVDVEAAPARLMDGVEEVDADGTVTSGAGPLNTNGAVLTDVIRAEIPVFRLPPGASPAEDGPGGQT